MSIFQSLKNDRVTLVKKDGQRFENLTALVQAGLIKYFFRNLPLKPPANF